MTKRPTILALATLGCALALPAGAQNMRPGLWELNNKMSSPDGKIQAAMAAVQEHMANMSPEQRKSMQQMMERNGMQMNMGPGGAMTTRMCMTKEMIQRREFPVQEGDCKHKLTPVSASRMKVDFSCTRPKMSGTGEMTLDSDTSYRARMHMTGTPDGQPQSMDMEVAGKWLSADCGSIRPVAVPQAK